jgi:N-acetylglucosaminyl-diphospho-decaprenol L-rhamnosyltransferase
LTKLDRLEPIVKTEERDVTAIADIGQSPSQKSHIGISAVVITCNRRRILQHTIKNLLRGTELIDEIVLVDNGSIDGTAEMIATKYPGIRLIRLGDNVGIPRARNIGALNAKRELLLFLDDDGTLDCSWLQNLACALSENEHLAAISCKVVNISRRTSSKSTHRPKPQETNKHKNHEKPDLTTSHLGNEPASKHSQNKIGPALLQPTYTFFGGAVLMKKSAFLSAGMFPEHFFYSGEEDDLSFRLIARGYWLASCRQAVFTHYRVAKKDPHSRKRRVHNYYRNRQYIIWRNLPGWIAVRESLITLIGGAIRTAFTKYFFAFLTGSLSGLIRLVGIIRSERHPLSKEQYKIYRESAGVDGEYPHRLAKLFTDMRTRRRIDWI